MKTNDPGVLPYETITAGSNSDDLLTFTCGIVLDQSDENKELTARIKKAREILESVKMTQGADYLYEIERALEALEGE